VAPKASQGLRNSAAETEGSGTADLGSKFNRLQKAAANQDTTDLLAAQALLQSGTAMLTEARKERDSLQQITLPSKKQEVK